MSRAVTHAYEDRSGPELHRAGTGQVHGEHLGLGVDPFGQLDAR
jgi:hypothetical protein